MNYQSTRQFEVQLAFLTMTNINLVPRVFALGERNTLVWPGHVTRGFCVKWRIVY